MPGRSLCVNIAVPSLTGEGHLKCVFHHVPRVPQRNPTPCLAINPSVTISRLHSPTGISWDHSQINYSHSTPCLRVCFCENPSKKTHIENPPLAESTLEAHSYANKWILRSSIITHISLWKEIKWVVEGTWGFVWNQRNLASRTFPTTYFLPFSVFSAVKWR